MLSRPIGENFGADDTLVTAFPSRVRSESDDNAEAPQMSLSETSGNHRIL